jgi:hypothetical protein
MQITMSVTNLVALVLFCLGAGVLLSTWIERRVRAWFASQPEESFHE